MTFGRPDLLWLGLAAVPVLVLHLVRRRRPRTRVPSLLLWDEVFARANRRPGLSRLSALLSLLLVLLALGAGTLAAADPRTGQPAPVPRPLLLAIDGSARMEGARFEAARAIARAEIARKASIDPVTIVLVSSAPRVLARNETEVPVLLRELAGATPRLVPADWSLADAAVRDVLAAGGRAVAIGVSPPAPPGAAVRTVPGENVGITAFSVRTEDREVRIRLGAAGELGHREFVATLGGAEVGRVPAAPEVDLAVPRGEGGTLRVAIDPPAGPAFDDAVEAEIPAPVRLRVGVVAPDGPGPFLAAALAVLGSRLDAEGSGTLPPDRLAEASGAFDVLVLTGEIEGELPPGNYLVLGPPPRALGLKAGSPVPSAPIWEKAAEHPVTRGVDTAEVQVLGATPAALPPGAVPLLSVPAGAVAAVGERDGVRWVWIGLGATDSTLPVTGAYPLLVRNALDWFAGLRAAPLPPRVRMGEPLRPAIRLPPGTATVSVAGPGEGPPVLVPVVNGWFEASLPEGIEGEVTVRIGAESARTRVDALLPGETAARRGADSGPPAPDRSSLRDTRRRPWPAFAAAAVLFLLVEWLVVRGTL